VKVPEQNFLIAQREVGDHPGADHGLGGLQRVRVLRAVFLERQRGPLVAQSTTSRCTTSATPTTACASPARRYSDLF
jgi:hypothetical protein